MRTGSCASRRGWAPLPPTDRRGLFGWSWRQLALAEAALVTLAEASGFVGIKLVQDELSPLAMTALRNGLTFVALLPVFAVATSPQALASLRRPGLWTALLTIGLLGYSVGSLLTFNGIAGLPATTTGLVQGFRPVLALVLGALILRDIPSWVQAAGVAIMLLGVYVFFPALPSPPQLGSIGLLFLGFTLMTLCQVIARGLGVRGVGAITVATIPFGIGGLALGTLLLATEGPPRLSWWSLGVMLFLSIGASALGFTLLYHALQTLTNLEVSSVTNLVPLVTAGLATLVLGESLTGSKVVGLLVTLLGVFVVQWHAEIRGFARRGRGV